MKATSILVIFLGSVTLAAAVIKVTDIIKDADRSKCDCCYPPCCCKCARRVTEEEIHTLPPSTTPMPTTTTTGVVECNNTLDLVFIVDSSGSISSENWKVAKKFIVTVVETFDIGFKDTRVGVVQYATNASVEFTLAGKQNKNIKTLKSAILDIEQIGTFTNTVEAMEAAVEDIFGAKGDRKSTPNACVLISDGRSNFRTSEVEAVAKRLQKESPVVAIGVTNEINMTELQIIATGENGENVFNVDSFKDLKDILNSLVKVVCEEIPTRPAPTDKVPRTTKAPQPGKVEEHCLCWCPRVKYDDGGCDECPAGYGYH